MGIFDFFKKQKQQVEITIEKISFKDTKNWIQNKKQELKKQDQDFLNEINSIIKELIDNLKESTISLKNVDLNKKKAEERVKIIVQQNLENYMNNINELIEDLSKLNELNSSKDIIKKIDSLFSNFQKKSELNFQKATFLIGELGEIRDKIEDFFKKFDKLLTDNQSIINTSNITESIDKKLKKLSEIEEANGKIKTEIESDKDKIDEFNKKIKDLKISIEQNKQSNEYKEEIDKIDKIKNQQKELEKEIYILKSLVDLKILANIFHKNEKEMALIKKYKENFLKAFKKDPKGIMEIIDSTSQIENKPAINKKIETITKLNNEIQGLENLPIKFITEIDLKNSEVNKLNSNIKDINNNIEKLKKRYEKTKIIEKGELEMLKIEFKELNIELSD